MLERPATALDDLADHFSLAQPTVLPVHYQYALLICPHSANHIAALCCHLHLSQSCLHTREGKRCGSGSSEEGEGQL